MQNVHIDKTRNFALIGHSGDGKTTLGELLARHLDTPFIIDGDEFRGMFTNQNYRRDGRVQNIKNANAVTCLLIFDLFS